MELWGGGGDANPRMEWGDKLPRSENGPKGTLGCMFHCPRTRGQWKTPLPHTCRAPEASPSGAGVITDPF